MATKKRLIFMDLSAIISSFAVVVLHTSGNIIIINANSWKHPTAIVDILIQIVFAFGVPMFFMQSGANILNYRKRYNTTTFFSKRIKKVVIPFIIWSIFAFILLCFQENKLLNFFKLFLGGNIMGPYWFFYAIIGFYCCVPFLSIIIDNGTQKLCLYILALTLIVNSILPLISQVLKVNNGFEFAFPAIGRYLQWFIAGYYIVHYEVKHKKIIYSLGIISLVLEIALTFLATFATENNPYYIYVFGSIVTNFYDISRIFAFLTFSSLFLFLKNSERILSKCKYAGGISVLSRYTYGVYLIHPIFLMLYMKLMLRTLSFIPLIIQFVILPILVYCLSVVLTILIKKIPYVGRILLP